MTNKHTLTIIGKLAKVQLKEIKKEKGKETKALSRALNFRDKKIIPLNFKVYEFLQSVREKPELKELLKIGVQQVYDTHRGLDKLILYSEENTPYYVRELGDKKTIEKLEILIDTKIENTLYRDKIIANRVTFCPHYTCIEENGIIPLGETDFLKGYTSKGIYLGDIAYRNGGFNKFKQNVLEKIAEQIKGA